jgi:hypothetical protein
MPRFLLAVLILGAVPTAVAAQSVAYEGFNYSVGSGLNAQSGGAGWGNAWNTNASTFTVASGSVSNPQNTLATSGNRLDLAPTGSFTTAGRSLSTDLTGVNGGSVWLSFTITRTSTVSGGYGGIVIGNDAGSSATTGRLFVGNPGSFDNWSLERAGGGVVSNSNFTVTQNPTALLVVNIQFNPNGAETILLYVNRTPGGSAPGTPDASLTNLDINPTPANPSVTDLGVWYQSSGYQIDEIRVGTSYADVTPVPEPALVLAVAAGGVGLFTALRRRHPPGRP